MSIYHKNLKLVQDIGNEICEGCGTNSDCNIDPEDCSRVTNSLTKMYYNHLQKNNIPSILCNDPSSSSDEFRIMRDLILSKKLWLMDLKKVKQIS